MYPNFNSFYSRSFPKCYITLSDLASWAYNITQRTPADHQYHDAYQRFSTMFDGAQTLFDGSKSYTDPQTFHNEIPSIIHYPKILQSSQSKEIINFYLAKYSERLLMNPVEVGKFNPAFDIQRVMDYDDAMYATLTRIELLIKNFIMFNSEKYLRILALLNLKHNPIDNYDGIEQEDTSYDGTESVAHTVDSNKLDSTRITGPAKDISITTDIDGKKEVSFSFDSDFKKKSVVAQTSDTENGKVSGAPSIDSSGNPSTSSSTGTGVASKNYTTTYDDSTEGRLKDYTTDEGSVANSQKGVSEENMPLMAEITAGNPNNPSYTDSKSFTNRTDGRSLKKWGNMGVTTSQQMINQEMEMVKEGWNVIQTFCDELNREIFLSCYNF